MKNFWMTFVNDGVELFGTHCQTRDAALEELKKAYRFDHDESPNGVMYNDYYIEEYFEGSFGEIYVGKEEHFRMSIGKRGGVKAMKIREE